MNAPTTTGSGAWSKGGPALLVVPSERPLCTMPRISLLVQCSECTRQIFEDGRLAVSASWDATLKVWDLKSGRELRTLTGHSRPVEGVVPNGRLVVSASRDRTFKLWEVESGRELQVVTDHSGGVEGIASSADGRLAVSASKDKTLKVCKILSHFCLLS